QEQTAGKCEFQSRRPHRSGPNRKGAPWASADKTSRIPNCSTLTPDCSACFDLDQELDRILATQRREAGGRGVGKLGRQRGQWGKKTDRPNNAPSMNWNDCTQKTEISVQSFLYTEDASESTSPQ